MTSAASAADADDVAPPPQQAQPVAVVVPLVAAWAVDRTFDYTIPDKLAGAVAVGSLVRVPFGGRKVRGIVTSLDHRVPDRPLDPIVNVSFPYPVAPPPLPQLYEWVAERYAAPRGRTYERAVPPRVRVSKPTVTAATPSSTMNDLVGSYDGGPDLLAAIANGDSGTWSLRPFPGHERGQLISELIAAMGGGEGAALVTVPEVHFGSRVIDVLTARFPGVVRVDSSVDDMARSQAWAALAAGTGVGVGGRAAVFAPSPTLRLLVVDDEHDSVYKEDRSPRYDARRVAVERARLQGAVCVLVSPTPTLETGSAAAAGSIGAVVPPKEARKAARPVVEMVAPPDDGGLSPDLHARMRDALRDGGSVALLVPARGYARTLWCAQCRRSVRCPVCEAGLAYELDPLGVRCRRCGFSSPPPDACPSCSSTEFRYLGRGAERYAEQLARSFPRVPVMHMDRRAAESGGGARSWRGNGIYVTTWFGTKPELRPPVSLVGVVDADALVRRPDFRAAEQAHQVLVEMSEWAGPASAGGRLVMQTTEPGHHALQAVARADYDFFLQRELELRRELSYPPFTELIKVSSTGPQGREAIDSAAEVARSHGARVLGPIAAPFPEGGRDGTGGRIEGLQSLLKCPDAQSVAAGLRDILPGVPRGTRLRVDVDPR